MAKLKLDLDQIDVQTFAVRTEDDRSTGTILGHDSRWECAPPTAFLTNCPSMIAQVDCPQSYYGTCQTCGNTCVGCTQTCPTNGMECWEES